MGSFFFLLISLPSQILGTLFRGGKKGGKGERKREYERVQRKDYVGKPLSGSANEATISLWVRKTLSYYYGIVHSVYANLLNILPMCFAFMIQNRASSFWALNVWEETESTS